MSQDLALYSATQLLEGYRRRDFTPMEATEACLARIERLDGNLNAFVFVDQEGARKAARDSTLRWQTGKPQGRVDGVPTTIKDILLWKGHPTLRGSKSVDPKGPWDQDAPSVARLKEEGAVFLGKTTTPEFGWKGVTDSPLTGITRNPWDKDKTPGGSSGGASAAAAAGFGALHLGTDGGGSIRIPAGFTGIFGLKPTFGRVPAWPLSPYGTVAHVGPMTRTVADAALLLSVIQRFDARDVYALPPDDTDYLAKILKLREAHPLAGKKLAFTTKLGGHDTHDAIAKPIREAAERFRELGAVVEEKEPALPDLLPVFTILWFAGAGQVLKTIAEEHHKKLDPGFLEVAQAGQKIQLADYLAAVKAREAAGQVMAAFHETYDALLLPTLPVLAFKAGEERPEGTDRWTSWTPFTYPFNLTQQPAAAVPCGQVDGLPVSLQIVAPRHRDDRALQLSAAYEMLVGGFALPKLA